MATSISSDGSVVGGWAEDANGTYHAFVWTRASGMVALPQPPNGVNSYAYWMDASGDLVGASEMTNGSFHTVRWTPDHQVHDLGTLSGPGGVGPGSNPRAIASSGEIVGQGDYLVDPTTGEQRGYWWTPTSGGLQAIPTLGGNSGLANGVNNSGEVVGNSYLAGNSDSEAFAWTPSGGIRQLPSAGGTNAAAIGVNDSGEVVGFTTDPAGADYAAVWSPSDQLTILNAPPNAGARYINQSGQVAGESGNATAGRVFYWPGSGPVIIIPDLGGTSDVEHGINADGEVIGNSALADGSEHAFSWTVTGGTVDLGTLPGGTNSSAEAINDHGDIVGVSDDASGINHPVLWTSPQAPPAGLVTRSGATLLMNGQPFRPIGLNVYNANSTNNNCWYDMSSGSTLDDALSAMGPGVNTIRAWFFQSLATRNGTRDWTAFDHTLAVARAHGVKVIATLGNQWADCEPAAGYKSTAWYEGGYTQPDPGGTVSYRDWVQQVAARYKNDPTILAWQLLNEPEVMPHANADCSTVPESRATADLAYFAQDVSGAIKSADPNHLVSLGTIGSGQCGAQDTDYASVMSIQTLDLCEFHDYNPNALIPGDIYNGLQRRINQCAALNKPLLIGESGIDLMQEGGVNAAGIAKRAAVFSDKACAQLSDGVAGLLLWAWNKDGPSSPVNYPQDVPYDIGPGDPVLSVLQPWTNPSHTCSAPSSPGSVIAAAGDTSASVSWSSPSSDGGSAVSGYTVTANPGGASATVAGSQTTATVNGLTNGVSYTFTVTAASGGGISQPSGSSNAVAPSSGGVGVTANASSSTVTTIASAADPAAAGGTATSLTVPAGTVGGPVAITQSLTTQTSPSGYLFGGVGVDITAPAASPTNPLVLSFVISPPSGAPLDPTTLGATNIFRAEGTGTPVQIGDCESPTVAAPDPCVASRQYVTVSGATDIEMIVLTSSASRWNSARPTIGGVTVSDSTFTPTIATVQQGGAVSWTFKGKKAHTVTDSVGLGSGGAPLFASPLTTSGSFRFVFAAAGSYAYKSTAKGDALSGTVAVPVIATPSTGTTTTRFSVIWAASAPNGYVFDVQMRFKPRGSTGWKSWSSWKTGATTRSGSFVPTQGAGTYAFDSRIRNVATNRATAYSPDAQITVS